MWVGCKGISFHITVLVHTGPLSFGREILSAFGLRNLFMARCVLEHLPLHLFRVPPSTGSVGTYLASQSSHLNVFFCCCICRRVFLFFLQNSHVCSFHFAFVGQFLYESIMYEHVAVEHLLFQVLQHRKHYTAHHKRLAAPNRKYVPIRERQR